MMDQEEVRLSRAELVDVALGKAPADLVIIGGRLVNVATAEIYPASIAVKGNRIAAVGDVKYAIGDTTQVIDAEGRFLCPGLIEAHLHSYHSYIGVAEFAEAMLCHGVTCYVDGFYGQGIVGGKRAVQFFKESFERTPLRILFLVPTLAYIQNRELGLTPAAGLSAQDMMEMLDWPGCYGLEEPPSGPIVGKWPEFVTLCEKTLEKRLVITGHAAALDDRTLQAYAAMGATTDHEAVTTDEALSRVRAGYKLFMRMASSAHHQPELLKAVTEHGVDSRNFGFCADEGSPTKITRIGTTVFNLRNAISRGVPPIRAVQMATLNNAEAFFAQHDIGQLAPGRFADVLLVDDLVEFKINRVVAGGKVCVEASRLIEPIEKIEYPAFLLNTVRVDKPVVPDALRAKAPAGAVSAEVRVIGVEDGSFVTNERRAVLNVAGGFIMPDLERDVLPLAMIDRFQKGTGIGAGFAQGFQLRRGAMASTVNAVCENLVVAGTNFEDMALACNRLIEIGGGFIVVADGKVLALVELPLLGLMNMDPLSVAMAKFDKLFAAVRDLGCTLSNPFMSLEFSFAAAGVPDVKLSDEGLVRMLPPERLSLVVNTEESTH
jgi:adenine deaminase